MTMTMRQICEVGEHILDLTKRSNAFMETDQGRKTESITHQTALYFQCVIGCMMKKEMTLQCGQSGLFNLHCSSIHPRQYTELEQVIYICQLLETLLHRTAHISAALEAVLLLFRITFAPGSPFSVHVRKLPLVTGNTLRAYVTILLLFLCVGNSKSLVYLVSTKVRVCAPPRWISSSPKFILAQREFAIP